MEIIQTINITTRRIIYSQTAQDGLLMNTLIFAIMVLSFISYLIIFKKYSNKGPYSEYDKLLTVFIGLYNALLWIFSGVFYQNKAIFIGLAVISALNSILMARVFIRPLN